MSIPSSYQGHRNSFTELNEVYFWTVTIKDWIPLLINEAYKNVIMDSLLWLSQKNLVRIYGYVIMPNHIHLLWEQVQLNGKEFPKNSFEKFTAHAFRRMLLSDNPDMLERFMIIASDRRYHFWQRDPLAVKISSREMASQKLDYIHTNPLQEHWKLSTTPESYRFSSASFYETGKDEWGILTHYMNVF